jgi:hypothetical protein
VSGEGLRRDELRALLQAGSTAPGGSRPKLVERFAELNDNAARLFATPEEGLNR